MFTLITLTFIALSTILASAKAYYTHVQQCIKLDALLIHAHTRRRAYNSVRANPPRNDVDTAVRPHAYQQPYESAGGMVVTEIDVDHHVAQDVGYTTYSNGRVAVTTKNYLPA